jgi:hypothetical protein
MITYTIYANGRMAYHGINAVDAMEICAAASKYGEKLEVIITRRK